MTRTDRPRLLIVATTYPRWPDDPGPAPFVHHLARAMSDRFHVTVLAPHHLGAKTRDELDGIEIRRFRYAWPDRLELLADGAGIQNNVRKSPLHLALAAPLAAAVLAAAARELRSCAHDFVNSHWLVPSGLAVAIAAPRGLPHVITVHAADYDLLARLPAGPALIRFMAGRARAIVCVSRRFLGELEDLAGGRCEVVYQPMGVDLSRFSPDAGGGEEATGEIGPGAPLGLFVGKLTPKKGVETLIRAAAIMKQAGRDFALAIVGDGELREPLERLAAELGVGAMVRFLGAVPNRKLPALYRAARVVAVPSARDARGETEGMPVVILEALASGTPVVASRLCSAPAELVGQGVLEIEPADPAALAAALVRALDGEVRVDASAVARFDLGAVAQTYARLFLGDP